MNKQIIVTTWLCLIIQHSVNAQTMGKPIAKMLSKTEVKDLISSGKAVYDSAQSEKDNLKAYRLARGQILYVRDDGRGALWESLEQIELLENANQKSISILNFEGWLNSQSDIEKMMQESIKLLSKLTNRDVDFSNQSLKKVDRIRIENIVQQKDIFYAILIYSCGYFAHQYGGILSKEQRHDGIYEPIVKGEHNRTYAPYGEYLKNFIEKPRISLQESIELEKIKYNLMKD